MLCVELKLECILMKLKETFAERKDSRAAKLNNVIKLLVSQHGLLRTPPFELRDHVLDVFRDCLKHNFKQVKEQGIDGILSLLKDNRLYVSEFDPEEDRSWLSSQLVVAVTSLTQQPQDIQLGIFKAFLTFGCLDIKHAKLTARIVTEICGLLIEAVEAQDKCEDIRISAEVALSQLLKCFVKQLAVRAENSSKDFMSVDRGRADPAVVPSVLPHLNEAVPVVQYMCAKLDEVNQSVAADQSCDKDGVFCFVLNSLHFLLCELPPEVRVSSRFQSAIWQKVAPVLIGALQSNIRSSQSLETNLQVALNLLDRRDSVRKAKLIFMIVLELIRLFGGVGHIRPVLETLLHRLLVSSVPEDRCEILKALNLAFSRIEVILPLSAPALIGNVSEAPHSDIALFRMVVVCMEDACLHKDPQAVAVCVENIRSLLVLLTQAIGVKNPEEGFPISEEYVNILNSTFLTVADASYNGPSTYPPAMHRSPGEQTFSPTTVHSACEVFESSSSDEEVSTRDSGDSDCEFGKPMESSADQTEHESRDVHSNLDVWHSCGQYVVEKIRRQVPNWCCQRSVIHLDEEIHKFSNVLLKDLQGSCYASCTTLITGEILYRLIYSVVCINYNVEKNLYHVESVDSPDIISEPAFMSLSHSWGFGHLSPVFLAELYQTAAAESWSISVDGGTLATTIQDIGLKGDRSCYLSVCERLHKAASCSEKSSSREAAKKLARHMLTSVWDQLVGILAVGMGSVDPRGLEELVANSLGVAEGSFSATINTSVTALQLLASLCCELEIQECCETIFSLLASSTCIVSETKIVRGLKKRNKRRIWFGSLSEKLRKNIYFSQVLSMNVLLTRGLELASLEPDCWKHVFRCCLFLSVLERRDFCAVSQQNGISQKLIPKLAHLKAKFGSKFSEEAAAGDDNEDECVDVYGFISAAATRSPHSTEIEDLLKNIPDSQNELDRKTANKAISTLSAVRDRMYEDAATKLQLNALYSFVKELCRSSMEELVDWQAKKSSGFFLLLQRLGDVMVRVVRSRRPLLHIMRTWTIASSHFVEVCLRFTGEPATIAVSNLHFIISAMLEEVSEIVSFRFNEKMLGPYEVLMRSPVVSVEAKEQILCSVLDIIESYRDEIKSGWNPVFRGLGLLHLPDLVKEDTLKYVAGSIEDIMRGFLSTNDPYVIADGSHEACLALCRFYNAEWKVEVCSAMASKYLLLMVDQLCKAHQTGIYPKFLVNFKEASLFEFSQVDPVVLTFTLVQFGPRIDTDKRTSEFASQSKNAFDILASPEFAVKDPTVVVAELADEKGAVKIVLNLISRLLVVLNTSAHPVTVISTILDVLTALVSHKEPDIAIFAIRYLVLPTLQRLMRTEQNLQLAKTLATELSELVVQIYSTLAARKAATTPESSHPMPHLLRDLFIIFIEACSLGIEGTARLGVSCFRHIITHAAPHLTSKCWDVTCASIYKLIEVSAFPLQQLAVAFSVGSEYYYGDLAVVQVAARSATADAARLQYLASQVFLMDFQLQAYRGELDPRCFTFLISETSDVDICKEKIAPKVVLRIPFKTIVVSLLAHQLTLHMMRDFLVSDSAILWNGLDVLSPSAMSLSCNSAICMKLLTSSQLSLLCGALSHSSSSGLEFDERPGLKFLIQKVACLEAAGNAYKRMGSAWRIKAAVLLEMSVKEIRENGWQRMRIAQVADELKKMELVGKTNLALLADHLRLLASLYLSGQTSSLAPSSPKEMDSQAERAGSNQSSPSKERMLNTAIKNSPERNEEFISEFRSRKKYQMDLLILHKEELQSMKTEHTEPEIDVQREESLLQDTEVRKQHAKKLWGSFFEALNSIGRDDQDTLHCLYWTLAHVMDYQDPTDSDQILNNFWKEGGGRLGLSR